MRRLVAIAVAVSVAGCWMAGCETAAPAAGSAGDTAGDAGAVDGADLADVADGSAADTGPGVPPDPAEVALDPAPATMQRLTRAQYRRAIQDVLGADIVVPQTIEPDVVLEGSTSLGAGAATVSAFGAEQYEAAAFAVVAQALDEARRAGVVGCAPAAPDARDDGCAAEALARLARRLWRRPATGAELSALVGVAGVTADTLGDFYEGVGFALAGILQSPAFLFRIEVGEAIAPGDEGAGPGMRQRTAWELASKLAFLLWDAPPDEVLLDAAEAGALATREGLLAEAQRLLDHERFRDGLRAFAVDWLGLHGMAQLQKDPAVFLHMTPDLGSAAREETLLGIERVVIDLDADFRELFTTRETFVDHTLAALYDVPAPAPEGFHLIELPADEPRRGVLGQAAFLAVHSHPTSSSATLRGKFIREQLLCTMVPIPPVNLSTGLPPATADAPTKKDRSVVHNEDPSCAGCHLMMDPMGLGLERFDGIGRLRWTENGAVIDPSGDVDGVPFADEIGLGQALSQHPQLPGCFVKHVYRWASGRMEVTAERPLLDALTARFADDGRRVKPLLMEVVGSPAFRRIGAPVIDPEAWTEGAAEGAPEGAE